MSDYLPDEVVVETILWRLPVKSIIQCRCVCKSWYSLITSRNFISIHHRKSLTKNPQIFLNQEYKYVRISTGSCSLLFDYQNHFRSMSIRLNHPLSSHNIHMIGSINGLICYSIFQGRSMCIELMDKLIVCNPSIGHFQLILLPNTNIPVRGWPIRGFGFDERTQDYRILLIAPREGIACIYSLNSQCWTELPKFNFSWFFQDYQVVFVNGRFHWLAYVSKHTEIIFFDLKSEAFGHILFPEDLKDYLTNPLRIMESWESSIAIFLGRNGEKNLWIMEEYGSANSWRYLKLPRYPQGEVFGFRNKDEVLVRCQNSKSISSLKISKNKLAKLLCTQDSLEYTVHKFVPSLVLLDKGNNFDVSAPTHSIVDLAAPTRRKQDISAPTRRKRIKTAEHEVADKIIADEVIAIEVLAMLRRKGEKSGVPQAWRESYVTLD